MTNQLRTYSRDDLEQYNAKGFEKTKLYVTARDFNKISQQIISTMPKKNKYVLSPYIVKSGFDIMFNIALAYNESDIKNKINRIIMVNKIAIELIIQYRVLFDMCTMSNENYIKQIDALNSITDQCSKWIEKLEKNMKI